MKHLERLVIDNIKRIRKERGISQEKLAESCNTATSYIGLMEIYRNVPKLSTIERIADALDVDPLEFFAENGNSPDQHELRIQRQKNAVLSLIEKELDKILRR